MDEKKKFGLTRTIRDGHGFCDATILYILSTVIDLERLYESLALTSRGMDSFLVRFSQRRSRVLEF